MSSTNLDNSFIVNNIALQEASNVTLCERNKALEQSVDRLDPLSDFRDELETKHDYKTIPSTSYVVPVSAQQHQQHPLSLLPTNFYLKTFRQWKATWDRVATLLSSWGHYPEKLSQRTSEYVRYFLADKKLLHISARGLSVTKSATSLARAFDCHPYLPSVAVAQQDIIALYNIPFSAKFPPKLLFHSRMVDIGCVAYRPKMGNCLAVGCRNGVAVWTIKQRPSAQPYMREGYHHPTTSWVVFLHEPQLGEVISVAWDSGGEYLIAGSATSGRVGVWHVGSKRFNLLSNLGPVELVLWSPCNNFLFTSNAGGILSFWEDGFLLQELAQLGNCQAASFSPDGRFLAVATSHLYIFQIDAGSKERVKCVFVEPNANIAHLAADSSEIHLLQVENLAWSPDGERLALSFTARPIVALYSVSLLSQNFSLYPIGYINPSSVADYSTHRIKAISFLPNFERGSLLCSCYSNGMVAFTPLYYEPTTRPRNALPRVERYPTVLAQQAIDLTPLPAAMLTSPMSIPAAPSPIPGPVFSPIPSPSYRVLFHRDHVRSSNIASPGLSMGGG